MDRRNLEQMEYPFSRRNFFALASVLPLGASDPVAEYAVGGWPPNLGNHRARLRVTGKPATVSAHIPWRRRDDAASKDVVVIEASTGQRVNNVARVAVNREFCDLVFEPPTAPGEYHVYYMTQTVKPVPHAYAVEYLPPRPVSYTAPSDWQSLPKARLLDIQARSEFDRFDPMEVVASESEVRDLLARYPGREYLVFPEDRQHPIRMTDNLPLRWVRIGPSTRFHGEARRGEFYVFQLGVWAARSAIADLALEIRGLGLPWRCFNLAGTDWLGRSFTKKVSVEKGKVQALWCGIEVPRDAAPGTRRGEVILKMGPDPIRLDLSLTITAQEIEDAGDNELWRHSRLRWLDSTTGIDEDVVAPYVPLESSGETVRCLGREIRFGALDLPESIRSGGVEILAAPIRFQVDSVQWNSSPTQVVKSTRSAVIRETESRGGDFSLHCSAKMEFDGYVNYRLRLTALREARVSDLRLEIPIRRAIATYMMGLGRKGGFRPAEWKWNWDENRANHSVWIGDVPAGLQLKLKGPEDSWELYNFKPHGVPKAWNNDGKGGCTVNEEGDRVVIRASTGARSLAAGEELWFCFGLLATPVKPLDPAHWSQRYYHQFVPPETAAASGATILNVHHGNDVNRYINYPFIDTGRMAAYVSEAHEKGLKVKIYYTVRELSNRVAEMWALRSLGEEIFTGGPGGGHSWLREHLAAGYAPAWHHTFPDGEVDAAIATTGMSRWHNYYLEGLAWLLRNIQVDGLYLDGIGYNREVMKRVRKVMDHTRPGCLIDFHSGNEFPFEDLRISPANKYMEHFPYINSLWFGEGYDYNESPDYWLVEISGIPFGLFSEMLERNGNPWRGMIYGMTARYYSGADPKHLWKLWDQFKIQEARMIGYWDPACPVRTDHKQILATAYAKKGEALIALASWEPQRVRCRLNIDWKALGLNPQVATLHAPAIPNFQDEARFNVSDEIPVEPGRGWLFILRSGRVAAGS
jgi:hypothetical protein